MTWYHTLQCANFLGLVSFDWCMLTPRHPHITHSFPNCSIRTYKLLYEHIKQMRKSSMFCKPKIQTLNLMRKHQINPNSSMFYKVIGLYTSKNQGQKKPEELNVIHDPGLG